MAIDAAPGIGDNADNESGIVLDPDYRMVFDDRAIMDLLLTDRTTERNIVWATDSYADKGEGYGPGDQIQPLFLMDHNNVIRPRTRKTGDEQKDRTVDHAEVFTPPWIVNRQNNLVDEQWVGVKNPFNTDNGKEWTPNEKVDLGDKTWMAYVRSPRLEVCCGEAPYITTRYDAVTGFEIPVKSRVGLLDRKLRVVSENTESEEQWLEWAKIGVQNIYGYEMQGDSLLLARENILLTYIDHFRDKFSKDPERDVLKEIAEIISWNIWQMDGITNMPPFPVIKEAETRSFGSLMSMVLAKKTDYCRIRDWNTGEIEKFFVKEKARLKKDAAKFSKLDAW